ncbi:terminase TerL endonuclease subunit [Prevotella intermedia]|uniref:terminase TerL endonuclease subunit n=1 Tax=Prevotella intermedia TaxID=28131 RepID=UPI0027BACFB0|nr:terminase TerL endonuclease subunit [Prevotella intermedia]
MNNPSEEVGVKTKTLNLWCDVADVWLPESYIVRASKEIHLEDFRDCECYIGVDLSATSDLTAVSYLIEKDNTYYFKTDYYLPESALRDKPDRETYKLWKQ